MKLSRSTGYAVLAAGYIAKHQGKGVVLSQDIAEAYGIPLEYLLKILQHLVRANVLRSKRGPRGGFCLARPTTRITILDIIEAVDGPLAPDLSMAEQAGNDRFAVKADKVYEKALGQARKVFGEAVLSGLIVAKK